MLYQIFRELLGQKPLQDNTFVTRSIGPICWIGVSKEGHPVLIVKSDHRTPPRDLKLGALNAQFAKNCKIDDPEYNTISNCTMFWNHGTSSTIVTIVCNIISSVIGLCLLDCYYRANDCYDRMV